MFLNFVIFTTVLVVASSREFELKLKPFGFTMQPKPSSSEKDTTGLYSSINNKDNDMDSLEGLFRDWSIGLSRKDEYPIFSKLNYQTRGRLQLQKEKKENKDIAIVSLYYETLCPYCRKFDSIYLSQMIKKLYPRVEVATYPFGNGNLIKHDNGSITVKCHHGPAECYGNKLHACALNLFKNNTEAVLLNGCTMSDQFDKGSDDPAFDHCGKVMNIDAQKIDEVKKCAKGPMGHKLLVDYGVKSETANFQRVPFVVINGDIWKDDNYEKFFDSVCAYYKDPPAAC